MFNGNGVLDPGAALAMMRLFAETVLPSLRGPSSAGRSVHG